MAMGEVNQRQSDDWYRKQARKNYQDEGFFEIDENAPISQAEGNPDQGAYVQAWVAHPAFRGDGLRSNPISDPSRALPRLRTLCTNSKKPRYSDNFSCE